MTSQIGNPADTRINCAPKLTPKVAPWMSQFVNDPANARRLIAKFGSPLHLVATEEFSRNVGDLLAPLQSRGLEGGLYFARKANKLPWFVQTARDRGIGVDTATLVELRETLQLGVPARQVVSTAIGKGRELIELAVQSGSLLIVDNDDELKAVKAVSQELGKRARLGLRFSGFTIGDRKVFSRFGFAVEDAGAILDQVLNSEWLQMETLHAHLDRYDVSERAAAARKLIEIAAVARAARELTISGIDLGGGILMRYLVSEEEWHAFEAALVEQIEGKRAFFTFQNDGLGYFRAGDKTHGKADLYPAWNAISKERFIAAILDHEGGNRPLWRELRDANLQIYFEPGRAMLDNVGITLATVTFRKRDAAGNLLIGVEMNRTNLRPFRAEFCSDPMLLCEGLRQPLSEGAFIVGNLCSESDLIFRRRLRLPVYPEPGDVVCFFNSAGYLAHHMEIGTHGNALPKNILISRDTFAVEAVYS